ncbi:MAG TPA: ABC transporter permease subunit [Acetobacteraceae bacterium]|nr:ABC transporter permease subunit [Acetobacteraceae bacterium]
MTDWLAGFWAEDVPMLASGLWMTLELLVLSSIAGIILAVPLALARLAPGRLLPGGALAYSVFFRGTPLLVQIFLIYYGAAQFSFIRHSAAWVVLRDAFPCALIALSLNMAAYVAEVLRAGILAVPQGEREAALALGMGPVLRYRRIILPRAVRLVLPALSNELVIQLKSTSLASTVTLLDVTGAARRLAAASYTTDPLLVAGGIYVVLTWGIARGFRGLERGLIRDERR